MFVIKQKNKTKISFISGHPGTHYVGQDDCERLLLLHPVDWNHRYAPSNLVHGAPGTKHGENTLLTKPHPRALLVWFLSWNLGLITVLANHSCLISPQKSSAVPSPSVHQNSTREHSVWLQGWLCITDNTLALPSILPEVANTALTSWYTENF